MLKISSIIKNKKVIFIIIILLCIAFAGLWNVVSEGYDRQNKTILFLKKFIPTKVSRKVRDIIFIIPDLKERNKFLSTQVQKYEQNLNGELFNEEIVLSKVNKKKYLLKEFFLPFPRLDTRLGWAATSNSLRAHHFVINGDKVVVISGEGVKDYYRKRGYKEEDILGGKDPYSASKASAELVIQSYVNSFFPIKKTKIFIGIARAGNVIGGGDWSENRLIPDCVKSWSRNKKVLLRNPNSTRPWQHVLEAIGGYLKLAMSLNKDKKLHGEAFNFGPNDTKNYKVMYLVKLMKKYWKKVSWKLTNKKSKNFYESNLLKLNCNKSKIYLKWKSILNFKETIGMVATWYKNYYLQPKKIYAISLNQIKEYDKLLEKRSIK